MVQHAAAPEDEKGRRLTYVAFSCPQVLLSLTYCRTRRPVLDGQERPAELIHRVA